MSRLLSGGGGGVVVALCLIHCLGRGVHIEKVVGGDVCCSLRLDCCLGEEKSEG